MIGDELMERGDGVDSMYLANMKYSVMSITCDINQKSKEANNLKMKQKYVLSHNILWFSLSR